MIAKEDFSNLKNLKHEIVVLEKEIFNIQKAIDSLSPKYSNDSKNGGADNNVEKNYTILLDKKEELESLLLEYNTNYLEAMTFLENIKSSKIRLIFMLRYIQGKTWLNIANDMNLGLSDVKMTHNRYLSKNT